MKTLVKLFAVLFLIFQAQFSFTQLSGIHVPPHDIGQGTAPQGDNLSPVALSKPVEGSTVYDSTFGTTIRRLNAGHFHVYSQLQSFSFDNQYVILIDPANGYGVYRLSDLTMVNGSQGWHSAYRWIPETHKIIILEGDPVKFRVFDCDTESWSLHMELPDYRYASGSRSFEELSHDGKWTAVYVNNDGEDTAHIISVNLDEKRIGMSRTTLDLGAWDDTWGLLEPDWVGVSPLGNYVVVQWVRDNTIPASGLELYDIETGAFVRRIYTHHNHSDIGVDENGKEYIATSESASPVDGNFPGLVIHYLDGSPPLHLRPMPWARMEHLSCQGPDGVVIITAGGDFDGQYKNEIYAAYHDGSLQRLVHHRSTSGEYWVQPKASCSRDGTFVIWSSDWDNPGDQDAYVIQNLTLTESGTETKYQLTVNGGTGSGNYADSTQVTVSAQLPPDNEFLNWTGDVQYLTDSTAVTTTLTMPASDAEISAVFELVAQNWHLAVNNGSGSGDYQSGEAVNVSANVRAGYVFTEWSGDIQYLDNKDSASTLLNMPAGDVTITAEYIMPSIILNASRNILIYPNPVNDNLFINSENIILYLSITDLFGREVYGENLKVSSHMVNLAHLKKGIYILSCVYENGEYNRRKIIKN